MTSLSFSFSPLGKGVEKKKGPHEGPRRETYRPNVHTPDLEGLGTRRKLLEVLHNGAWRSPVARLLWEQEVAGSNPVAPMDVEGCKRRFLLVL